MGGSLRVGREKYWRGSRGFRRRLCCGACCVSLQVCLVRKGAGGLAAMVEHLEGENVCMCVCLGVYVCL